MITKTTHNVSLDLIKEANLNFPEGLLEDGLEFTLNTPNNHFFYDSWSLKDEYIGTVWEKIYNSLPADKGEARIIRLNAGECYISHADIDDRYHLNLSGVNCFLIDLDTSTLHDLKTDGVWYDMNAGKIHTAANFGNRVRFQLVIRKLLHRGNFNDRVDVTIQPKTKSNKDDCRYLFDGIISPWLNDINKKGLLDNFMYKNGIVNFTIDHWYFHELQSILPNEFVISI
jgi:hypothetical protein